MGDFMMRKARILAGIGLLMAAPAVGGASDTASLEVRVTGLKSTDGNLIACVWKEKSGFPTCQKSRSAVKQTVKVTGTSMTVRFNNLSPGSYAVTVQHDADSDGKLKTNFIGMPKEGVGVSNNPGGIPKWDKAQMRLNSGANTAAVTIRYL
jgi:uncharacterized protein (DUF2141 family)